MLEYLLCAVTNCSNTKFLLVMLSVDHCIPFTFLPECFSDCLWAFVLAAWFSVPPAAHMMDSSDIMFSACPSMCACGHSPASLPSSSLVPQVFIAVLAAVPSPELVDRVRDLYQKRVSDVRFLIPVLNGLSKVSSFLSAHMHQNSSLMCNSKLHPAGYYVYYRSIIFVCCIFCCIPSVLWRCWLGGRKGIL